MTDFERRLTTIMFTDIVGYSAIMGKNEELGLKWLDFYQQQSNDVVKRYHGTIIKKMGDGMLMVFNSVKEAIDAAKMLQQEILTLNKNAGKEERLLLRIGVHVGDVLVKEGDIFGNGVNVAARLQQISLPGGVCLSDAAYAISGSEARNEFVEIKDVALKNIAENYTVYQLPSIYPEDFPVAKNTFVLKADYDDFVITSMRKIPPEKLPLLDAIMLGFFTTVLFDIFIAFSIALNDPMTFAEVISDMLTTGWILFHNLFFFALLTFLILRDAVEIKFLDVREADSLISYVIQQFGFRPPERENGKIIFRPSWYNRLMWQTQKMRVVINGNKMAISGSYLFLRRVKKMLRSYMTAAG